MLVKNAHMAAVGTVSANDITKESYVVYPTVPVSTGAKANTVKLSGWDEYVYIVPVDLKLTDKIGNLYDGPLNAKWLRDAKCYKPYTFINSFMSDIYASVNRSGKVVTTVLTQYQDNYNKHLYNGNHTKVGYKMFFNPTSCNDSHIQNMFESARTTRDSNSKFGDSSAQLDYKELQKRLYLNDNSIYSTVVKTMYMLKYGKAAKANYKDKTLGKDSKHYKYLLGKSVRFLWGEYQPSQWHRGVDFYVDEKTAQLYSICEGEIIKKKSYCFYVYNKDFNITVTYVHVNQATNIQLGKRLNIGDEIGTEGKVYYDSEADLTDYPAHTHIQIDEGYYTGDLGIPWSADSAKWADSLKCHINNFTIKQISMNPYRFFDEFWNKAPE